MRLERAASLEALRDDWTRLAEHGSSVFSTWEWADTWWAHHGRGRRLHLWACKAGDEVVALIPLYEWSGRPLRIARFVGHGPADELGPVCPPELREELAPLIRHAALLSGADVLLAEQLPEEEGWSALLGACPVRREAAPVLRWNAGWSAFLGSRSANLREQIGRRERRLQREHSLRLRLTDDLDSLSADLHALFRLHRALRARSAFAPEAFHRAFAETALRRGWLRLWTLELDGRPAAAWYGFRFRGVEHYYQAGRDPSLDHLSVGFVLLAHTIRAALEDGVDEYRFGRGDEAYKYRFANVDGRLETIALGQGFAGSVSARAVPSARAALALARRGLRVLAGR